MTGSQRIEWRSRSPRRALSNLRWYGAVAVVLLACVWLLFGSEPETLNDGSVNPLASIPVVVTLLSVAGAAGMMVPVVRRPTVAANHYALVVRAGLGRTLTLPWAAVAEIAITAASPAGERFLLVRLLRDAPAPVTEPGWLDRAPLRRLLRTPAGGEWAGYDLAVGMRDFAGDVQAQFGALAAFAPDTVAFVGSPLG